jgi:hypothetical protein
MMRGCRSGSTPACMRSAHSHTGAGVGGGNPHGYRHAKARLTDPPYFPPPAARCTADLIAPVMMLPRP